MFHRSGHTNMDPGKKVMVRVCQAREKKRLIAFSSGGRETYKVLRNR